MKRTSSVSHPCRNQSAKSQPCDCQLVLVHKQTGIVRCRLHADCRSEVSLLRAASLLALLCHARGESPLDYEVLERSRAGVLEKIRSSAAELLQAALPGAAQPRLTRREHQVLAGVADQLSNKEIAARLHLSERTVKFHVSSLLGKFRVGSRMALVREAYGTGLVSVHGTSWQSAGGTSGPVRFAGEARHTPALVVSGRIGHADQADAAQPRGLRMIRPAAGERAL